jgi:RNA polymerase sigma factor (sigma-70 family)
MLATSPCPTAMPLGRRTPGGTAVADDDADGPSLMTAHLATVNRAIAIVGARRRLCRTAREELSSDVYIRLLQRDGAALRKYRGESSLLAYLVVVVQRVLLDRHIANKGRWRPSAAARRLGQAAMLVERLVFGQGLSMQEAAPIVRAETGATHTDDEFEFLLSLLRPRVRRQVLDIASLDDLRADTPSPEDALVAAGAYPGPERLARAIERLAADDREMVQLRFVHGLRLREIARRRHIDERAIYRRFERVLAQLRSALDSRPLGPSESTACRPARWRP